MKPAHMRLQPPAFSSLDAQDDLFARCRGKRLFLSGATGFFGKWLLESFLHVNARFGLNARLTALSRDPRAFLSLYPWFGAESALTFVPGDVRDFPFPDGAFDFVIHAATEASAKLERENPAEMRSVIVDGTRRMLEFAVHSGASRFMMTSSGAVYGPQPPETAQLEESHQGQPTTSYGQGKLVAEALCAAAGAQHGFAAPLPRCFAFVGPYLPLDAHFAIGNFMRDCLEGRPIAIQGDGTAVRSYLYAADLVEWLWTILLRGEHGRPYNVGSGDAVSISDLARLVRKCAGTQNEIIVHGQKVEGARPARYVPSVARASRELGLEPRCSLEESITRTLRWHQGTLPNERPGF